MLASLLAATLLAAAPATPLETVKAGNADVQKAANAPGATVDQLATVVEKFVDFEELAKRALGKTWDTITPAQRKDFADTMKGLLRASYAQKAIGQANAQRAVRQGDHQGRGGHRQHHHRREEGPDPGRLQALQGGEGRAGASSTSSPTRSRSWRRTPSQFRKLIADKGFDGLLSTLKAKRAQLEKSAANTKAADVSANSQAAASSGATDVKAPAEKK